MKSGADMTWKQINLVVTECVGIGGCQRKLKSIVDNLHSMYTRCIGANEGTHEREFTGAEWLLIAIIEKHGKGEMITHGTNCEYPIIMKDHWFWKWLREVKDNPELSDN